jgi:K+ transporter
MALAHWVILLTWGSSSASPSSASRHRPGRGGSAPDARLFITVALGGRDHPGLVCWAPYHAVRFFAEDLARVSVPGSRLPGHHGAARPLADLGHFGHRAIQLAWFSVPLPALLLNYFGQGALLLRQPEAAVNPFYYLAPAWALYPLIALATAATIIASQAVISGAFSLTRQAVQLGYSPRMQIEHTSSREIGQIYVPAVNWALMLVTCARGALIPASPGPTAWRSQA